MTKFRFLGIKILQANLEGWRSQYPINEQQEKMEKNQGALKITAG